MVPNVAKIQEQETIRHDIVLGEPHDFAGDRISHGLIEELARVRLTAGPAKEQSDSDPNSTHGILNSVSPRNQEVGAVTVAQPQTIREPIAGLSTSSELISMFHGSIDWATNVLKEPWLQGRIQATGGALTFVGGISFGVGTGGIGMGIGAAIAAKGADDFVAGVRTAATNQHTATKTYDAVLEISGSPRAATAIDVSTSFLAAAGPALLAKTLGLGVVVGSLDEISEISKITSTTRGRTNLLLDSGQLMREQIIDVGVTPTGFKLPAGAPTIPEGIPKSWRIVPLKEGGIKIVDPANPHNSVRIMPGDSRSIYPTSRVPYVRWQLNGRPLDVRGNVLPSEQMPEAHIPLDKFRFHLK